MLFRRHLVLPLGTPEGIPEAGLQDDTAEDERRNTKSFNREQ
jgi:hypothetical protein